MSSNAENISPHVLKQVAKELQGLQKNPPEGIKVIVNESDLTDIQAIIEGPAGTPYEGGLFKMKLVLGKDFPTAPPSGFFVTKIFHPNVAPNGAICVNTLKKDWKSELGIKHVLLTVKCLLIVPNPASALNEEAGKLLLLEHYDDYSRQARMMTEIHALGQKSCQETNRNLKTRQLSDLPSENTVSKKRPAEEAKKKKIDKKRALKRL